MNSIELVAIETSGLKADSGVILEVAVARYVTGGTGVISGESSAIDPGDHDLSPEILHFHGQTGLIEELLKERTALAETAQWLGPCNLRVVWALEFARPWIAKSPLKDCLMNAIDARSVFELARVGKDYHAPVPNRAGPKVLAIGAALKELGV